jgi:hypothetical protein
MNLEEQYITKGTWESNTATSSEALVFSYTFLFQMHCGKNWMRRIWESTRRREEDAVLAVSHSLQLFLPLAFTLHHRYCQVQLGT